MKSVSLGKYTIVQLNKEDMASYFEQAFNNLKVKEMLNNSETLSRMRSNFEYFGNILQAYVTATGDVSEAMVEKLADDFKVHGGELSAPYDERNKLSAEQKYFGNHVMGHVLKNHAKRYGMTEPLSLTDTAQVLQSVKMNCHNNRFHTHSFNGALLNEVKTNGFDISKELFKEEYAVLKEVGLYQAYQTGNLLFCELGKATFGYAQYAPERLYHCVERKRDQNDTETINEFFSQSLKTALEAKGVDEATQKRVMAAGQKMIDFYCPVSAQSAIAFKPVSKVLNMEEKTSAVSELYYGLANSRVKVKVLEGCGNDEEFKESYARALRDIAISGKCDALGAFVEEFNRRNPDNHVFDEPLKMAVTKAVTQNCLNNFTYNGFADGYRIEGGKLAPDEFALATIPNPIDDYVFSNKVMLAIEKEKLMAEAYNRELYDKKYLFDIKTGKKPKESFEDYMTNNVSNTYFITAVKNGVQMENPKYTQWKKEKGYLRKESPLVKALEERAKENVQRKKACSLAQTPLKAIETKQR